MREEQDTRHAAGTNIKYQGYFGEVVSCDKVHQCAKGSDAKRSGAEKSPSCWWWVDQKKGPDCGKDFS